jgi:hypothetical protein
MVGKPCWVLVYSGFVATIIFQDRQKLTSAPAVSSSSAGMQRGERWWSETETPRLRSGRLHTLGQSVQLLNFWLVMVNQGFMQASVVVGYSLLKLSDIGCKVVNYAKFVDYSYIWTRVVKPNVWYSYGVYIFKYYVVLVPSAPSFAWDFRCCFDRAVSWERIAKLSR